MFLINIVTHHSIYFKNINIWNIFWAQTLSTPSRSTISLYVYHIDVHNTVQYCIYPGFSPLYSLFHSFHIAKNKKKNEQTKFKLVIVVYNENLLKLQNMIYANKKFANIYR